MLNVKTCFFCGFLWLGIGIVSCLISKRPKVFARVPRGLFVYLNEARLQSSAEET